MTLSRSAGAHTDAVLRIERGGLKSPDASEGEIAPRLLLDGEPLALSGDKWRISPWLLVTDDTATITEFLQMIQEGKAITLRDGNQTISLSGLKRRCCLLMLSKSALAVKPPG
ncbi:protein [Escherichia coli]|nr:protein [Escherichia coli]